MARLVTECEKGFNVVEVTVFEKPYAVYLGDCLIKSNLTYTEALRYIADTIDRVGEKNEVE